MEASFKKYSLNFKKPSGTSRGVLHEKDTWFLKIENEGKVGFGECGMFRGLSIDDRNDFEEKLQYACDNINAGLDTLYKELVEFPSIQFGLEMAFTSLQSQDSFVLYPSEFTDGKKDIAINGLIWMGEKQFMKQQIISKIEEGFRCLKLKIGAINFEAELSLLKMIRSLFSDNELEIRVDANGAFSSIDVLQKLDLLSNYNIHSIEQPIKQGQWQEMAFVCKNTPIPVALDEELIGVFGPEKEGLLKEIMPQYIILKPTLVGGYCGSEEWISHCEKTGIGWWVTSALESNIGLNAIAQWTYSLNTSMSQGLGTGGLFTNNIDSPLMVKNATLHYEPNLEWNFNF